MADDVFPEPGRSYRDAVDLARQARNWFDGPGLEWRASLPVAGQAAVATESLLTTARLMAVIAWALDRRHDRSLDAALPGFVSLAFVRGGALPGRSPLLGTPGGDIALASRQLVDSVAENAPAAPHSTARPEGLWRL